MLICFKRRAGFQTPDRLLEGDDKQIQELGRTGFLLASIALRPAKAVASSRRWGRKSKICPPKRFFDLTTTAEVTLNTRPSRRARALSGSPALLLWSEAGGVWEGWKY